MEHTLAQSPGRPGRGRLHREEGSDLRSQLTFAAGHGFLPPHSFPRAELPLSLTAPITAYRQGLFTDVSPSICARDKGHCINLLLRGTAASLSMFSHKVLGAFLPVGLPESGPPTGPSWWLRCLLSSMSSHVPNREVSRLGGPLKASNAGGVTLRPMSQVWVPTAVRATDPVRPLPGACSSRPLHHVSLAFSVSGTLSPQRGQDSHLMQPSPGTQGGVRNDRWVSERTDDGVGEQCLLQVRCPFLLPPLLCIQ